MRSRIVRMTGDEDDNTTWPGCTVIDQLTFAVAVEFIPSCQ